MIIHFICAVAFVLAAFIINQGMSKIGTTVINQILYDSPEKPTWKVVKDNFIRNATLIALFVVFIPYLLGSAFLYFKLGQSVYHSDYDTALSIFGWYIAFRFGMFLWGRSLHWIFRAIHYAVYKRSWYLLHDNGERVREVVVPSK